MAVDIGLSVRGAGLISVMALLLGVLSPSAPSVIPSLISHFLLWASPYPLPLTHYSCFSSKLLNLSLSFLISNGMSNTFLVRLFYKSTKCMPAHSRHSINRRYYYSSNGHCAHASNINVKNHTSIFSALFLG